MKPSIKITNKWSKWAYVMPEFIERCPDYKMLSLFNWVIDYNLPAYLHNLEGPAAIKWGPMHYGEPFYSIEGLGMTKDDWEAAVHVIKFNKKIEDLL